WTAADASQEFSQGFCMDLRQNLAVFAIPSAKTAVFGRRARLRRSWPVTVFQPIEKTDKRYEGYRAALGDRWEIELVASSPLQPQLLRAGLARRHSAFLRLVVRRSLA